MDKEIIVMPYGGVGKLAEKFKINRRAVYEALNRRSNSSRARMIRRAAMENGGRMYGLIEK